MKMSCVIDEGNQDESKATGYSNSSANLYTREN